MHTHESLIQQEQHLQKATVQLLCQQFQFLLNIMSIITIIIAIPTTTTTSTIATTI